MSTQEIVLFSTSMLAIINPLAAAVLFVSLAGKFDKSVQRRMANQSALAVLTLLLVFAWLGNSILGLMGLTTPMLQAAGGLILLTYGLRMVSVEDVKLTQAEKASAGQVTEEHWKALAVVPLAIPGTVGAGAITTVIIQASTFNTARDLLVISGVSLGMSLIMWLTFHSAGPIARRLGPIGTNIITRVMGILVTATAFGLLGKGVGGLLPGLLK
ncbi:MAG: MarC family protein [Acidobacteria bacterium]|nr:MarC family protein [Acidobacteriota bacterium]